jgi:hypothetical protein
MQYLQKQRGRFTAVVGEDDVRRMRRTLAALIDLGSRSREEQDQDAA